MSEVDFIRNPVEELVNKIYYTFSNFFGDSRVDLSLSEQEEEKFSIIVHWDEVIIENEIKEKHLIRDLYCKITFIRSISSLRPIFVEVNDISFTRSTYSASEFLYGYIHSHVKTRTDISTTWYPACFGNTDLDKHRYVRISNDFDLFKITQLCINLDKFVHIESKEGGPYKSISSIGTADVLLVKNRNGGYISPEFKTKYLKAFLNHILLSKRLRYCYYNDKYHLAMGEFELIKVLTNLAIEWINIYKKSNPRDTYDFSSLFKPYNLDEWNIYTRNSIRDNRDILKAEGCLILEFKGEIIKLHIDIDENVRQYSILSPALCIYIKNKILLYINLKFRNNDLIDTSIKFLF